MRTERDRARCVAGFVGPRCNLQGSWPFGPRRSCLRVNPPPGSRCLPCQILLSRPSELSGAEEISHALLLSICAAHVHASVIHMSLFQFGFERRKCPSALAETNVRREHSVKEEEKEEFEEEGSKRT